MGRGRACHCAIVRVTVEVTSASERNNSGHECNGEVIYVSGMCPSAGLAREGPRTLAPPAPPPLGLRECPVPSRQVIPAPHSSPGRSAAARGPKARAGRARLGAHPRPPPTLPQW